MSLKTAMNLFSGIQKFDGEKHSPLYTKDGFKIANYMGPGTDLSKRLNDFNNNRPLTFSDKVSLAHDIRYSLATKKSDIREADNIMINKIDEGIKNKSDYRLNLEVAKRGIQSKKLVEDVISNKGSLFGGIGKDKGYSKNDLNLMKGHLVVLQQQGYGYGINRRLNNFNTNVNYLKNKAKQISKKDIATAALLGIPVAGLLLEQDYGLSGKGMDVNHNSIQDAINYYERKYAISK